MVCGPGSTAPALGLLPLLTPLVQPEREAPRSTVFRKHVGCPGGFCRKVKPAHEALPAHAVQHAADSFGVFPHDQAEGDVNNHNGRDDNDGEK